MPSTNYNKLIDVYRRLKIFMEKIAFYWCWSLLLAKKKIDKIACSKSHKKSKKIRDLEHAILATFTHSQKPSPTPIES